MCIGSCRIPILEFFSHTDEQKLKEMPLIKHFIRDGGRYKKEALLLLMAIIMMMNLQICQWKDLYMAGTRLSVQLEILYIYIYIYLLIRAVA